MNKAYIPVILLGLVIVGTFYFLTFYSQEELAPGACSRVMANGDVNDKLNILYLGDRYVSLEEFSKDVKEFNDGFFTVEPYASLKDEFNVYRYDVLDVDLGCDQVGTVICSSSKVKNVGKSCPSDFVIVLSDYPESKDLVNPLRSASIFNLAYVNAADSFLVLSHESGHMVAGLADEYLIPKGKVPRGSVNCVRQCREFDVLDECKKGCVNNNHYRSIDLGLMRNYWDTDNFGVFNIKVLEETILGKASVNRDALFSPVRENGVSDVLVLDFALEDGVAKIVSVGEGEGYAPGFDNFGYSYVLGNGESRGFGFPTLYKERGDAEGMVGEYEEVEEFTLVVPKSDSIEIFDEDGVSLGEFVLESVSFLPGESVDFDVSGIYRKLYLYDNYKGLVDTFSLDCDNVCNGEVKGLIPVVSEGQYLLYYYKVGDGWKKVGLNIGRVSSGKTVELK